MTSRPPWWAAHTTRPVLPASATRHHRARALLVTLTAVTLFLTAFTTVLGATTIRDTWTTAGGALAHNQSTQALVGACGPRYTFPAADTGTFETVPVTPDGEPARQRYNNIVPAYGNYVEPSATPTTRFFDRTDTPPTVEELVGYMHDRAVIVAWYGKNTEDADLIALRALAHQPALNLIVAPWEATNRGLLPGNRNLAYATWGASQTCMRLVPAALQEFRDAHPPHTPTTG